MRYCLCFVLLFAVICCGLFSVSASAAVVEQYSYNGVVLPKLPEPGYEYPVIGIKADTYYLVNKDDVEATWANTLAIDPGDSFYMYHDGEWIYYIFEGDRFQIVPVWSSVDLRSPKDNTLYLSSSSPVITLVEVPDPPVEFSDLKSIMSAYTGQISLITIVNILVAGVGCSIGLVFLWWGIRKTTGMLIKAFKKGKLRI